MKTFNNYDAKIEIERYHQEQERTKILRLEKELLELSVERAREDLDELRKNNRRGTKKRWFK